MTRYQPYDRLLGQNNGLRPPLKVSRICCPFLQTLVSKIEQGISVQVTGPRSTFDIEETFMMKPFILTQAESDFIHHHRYEALNLVDGPAGDWLRANGIYASTMIPFLYVDQETNPRWLDRITEDPFPPFKPAWSSKEEFEARAAQIVESYPVIKGLPSALPGYKPSKKDPDDQGSGSPITGSESIIHSG
jgi:hypothetical protein